jgi:hypothetical protein
MAGVFIPPLWRYRCNYVVVLVYDILLFVELAFGTLNKITKRAVIIGRLMVEHLIAV